ncbi:hypothetical protein X777_12270 [Ooceraea biroi]|uniref:Mutator-like transposase domain-containing protein n=1 Tax=Ooceraea biroi TaxID=2015173 RepID=A0A026W1L9_OOCBI|nr:hypothetical protein X777_12270 [Ooceraea biroi]
MCTSIVNPRYEDNTVVESDRLDTNCIQESTRAGRTVTPREDDNNFVVESGNLEPHRIQENLPEGRRIVNISFMWNEIHKTFDNHVRGIECQFKDWKLIDSYRRGLKTQLFFNCQMCHYEDTIWSEPTESHVLDINTAAY